MNKNVAITLGVVVRVLMIVVAMIDFFGCFDTLSYIGKVPSDWTFIFLLMFLSDFTISLAIIIVAALGLYKMGKFKDMGPRTETSFLILGSLLMFMAGIIAAMMFNKYNVELTSEVWMLIILGITGIITGLISKGSINKGGLPFKVAGTIAGVCVFILCILVLSQNVGYNNSSKAIYVLLMLADIGSVIYLYMSDASYAPSNTNVSGGSSSGSKEHLPPTGHAYTPEEYYEKTGIKVNNHDKE